MQALISRFKNIQRSEASSVKLQRLEIIKEDLLIMWRDSFDDEEQDLIMEVNKDANREIDKTEHELNKAVATRRNWY